MYIQAQVIIFNLIHAIMVELHDMKIRAGLINGDILIEVKNQKEYDQAVKVIKRILTKEDNDESPDERRIKPE
jgi:hypothetical protein